MEDHFSIAALELVPLSRVLQYVKGKVLDLSSGSGQVTKEIQKLGLKTDSIAYTIDVTRGLPAKFKNRQYSAIVSLARLHHLVETPNRLPEVLAQELTNIALPSATLIIEDVPNLKRANAITDDNVRQSAYLTSTFFSNVVDVFSLPNHHGISRPGREHLGHDGIYADLPQLAHQLQNFGWLTQDCFVNVCPWHFNNTNIAYKYVSSLFDLDPSQEHNWSESLKSRLIETEHGIELIWALDCLIMIKDVLN